MKEVGKMDKYLKEQTFDVIIESVDDELRVFIKPKPEFNSSTGDIKIDFIAPISNQKFDMLYSTILRADKIKSNNGGWAKLCKVSTTVTVLVSLIAHEETIYMESSSLKGLFIQQKKYLTGFGSGSITGFGTQ